MVIMKGVCWRDGGRDGGRWLLPVSFVFGWAGFIVGVGIHLYAHHRLTFYPVSMPWNVHTHNSLKILPQITIKPPK